jgi:SAM-dependent methyltransferase
VMGSIVIDNACDRPRRTEQRTGLALLTNYGILQSRIVGFPVARSVITMHMLYHVADPARAVADLQRVLAPGGCLVVVLNADDHLGDLRQAVQQARYEVGLGAALFGERLRLAEGEAMLEAAFGSVVRQDFVSELVISRPEPLEAYVNSMIDTALLPGQRDEYVARVLSHLPRDRAGVVKIRTHPGCLVCS